jgi:hypothetical protein
MRPFTGDGSTGAMTRRHTRPILRRSLSTKENEGQKANPAHEASPEFSSTVPTLYQTGEKMEFLELLVQRKINNLLRLNWGIISESHPHRHAFHSFLRSDLSSTKAGFTSRRERRYAQDQGAPGSQTRSGI